MQNNPQTRIRRLAQVLYFACTAALVAVPVLCIVAAAMGELGSGPLREDYAGYVLPAEIPDRTVWLIRMIEALAVALMLYVLWQMRCLFGRYRTGETLSPACADLIFRSGQGLVFLGILGFVSNTIIVLILTATNPPGQKSLTIGFTDGDLGFLLAGGFVVVIGWVMGQAAEIADEHSRFV